MTKMFAKSILAVTPLPPAPPPSLSLRACAFALLRYKRALLMTARYGRAHGYLGADKVWGLYEDSFSFSGCSTTGLMGQTCAQMPPPDGPIPAGARTLRSANGTVVGEGVCCNSVIDSVVSAVRIGCDPPPPRTAARNGRYFSSVAAAVSGRTSRSVECDSVGARDQVSMIVKKKQC